MRDREPYLQCDIELKEDGFTPAESLTGIDEEIAARRIANRFFSFYEDPSHETPYNGQESSYLYVNGGPFNAEAELHSTFGRIATEAAINIAVALVENEGGPEWAPSPAHPVYKFNQDVEGDSLDWTKTTKPSDVFSSARDDILTVIEGVDSAPVDKNIILRMIFSQSYSVLESYLYDRLRELLTYSQLALKNFAIKDKDLKPGLIIFIE